MDRARSVGQPAFHVLSDDDVRRDWLTLAELPCDTLYSAKAASSCRTRSCGLENDGSYFSKSCARFVSAGLGFASVPTWAHRGHFE